jgi:hypothetical protein
VSNGTETIRDTVRETVKEARKAARESSKAAAEAAEEIQSHLKALREDVAQLAERLGLIVTAQGSRAWNRTKLNVGDDIADAESRVRQVTDDLGEAILAAGIAREWSVHCADDEDKS